MQRVDCDVDVGTLGDGNGIVAEGAASARENGVDFGVAGVDGNDGVEAECFFLVADISSLLLSHSLGLCTMSMFKIQSDSIRSPNLKVMQ